MTTEELPAGTAPQRRRRWPTVVLIFFIVVVGLAVAVDNSGVLRRLHVRLSPAVAVAPKPTTPTMAPGCSPGGLQRIWRVEDDAATLGHGTTSGQLYADVGRLEQLLVHDPRRWRFTWVNRAVLATTVGGQRQRFDRQYAAVVRAEPRC